MPVTCGKMESFPNCVGDRIKSSISTRGQGHTRNSSHSRLTTTCIQLCTIHCERGAPKRIQWTKTARETPGGRCRVGSRYPGVDSTKWPEKHAHDANWDPPLLCREI
jgi:hypothetical protein